MKQRMLGFVQDEAGDWIAELDCGHRRHVRHCPPLSERPWVLSNEGRRSRLGTEIECLYCQAAAAKQRQNQAQP